MSRSPLVAALFAAASLLPWPAAAHVGVEPAQATANTTLAVGFRIGHGCGESPTTAVRIRIPPGVTAVQPQAKAGWEVKTISGPAPASGVLQVDFVGGKLPANLFDTFVLRMKVPDAPNTTVYFPVVQECEMGVHRWIDAIVPGQPEPQEPMPGLRLVR